MKVNVSRSGLEAKRDAIVERTLHWWDRNRRDLAMAGGAGGEAGSLSRLAVGSAAATDHRPGRSAVFPEICGNMADRRGSGRRFGRGGDRRLRRPRLLFPRAQPARLREGDRARGGRFPDEEAGLRALPGVGDYTAAAIAAIAFGRQAAPVDGNIKRVMARLLALDHPVAEAKARIRAAALELAPSRRAGDFAQALMDIGATICRPRKPGMRRLSLERRLRRPSLRSPRSVPAAHGRQAEAETRRVGLFRSPRRRGLSRPPSSAARAAGLDRRAARVRLDERRAGNGLAALRSRSGALAQAARRDRAGLHAFRADLDRVRRALRRRRASRAFLARS